MNLNHLTDTKLCQLAEEAIQQMEYSHGNHWPLDVQTEHGKTTTKEIFEEVVSRFMDLKAKHLNQ